ncbi:MAG TPA: hypothetical protein VMU81_12620 [Acetobacteraceae bacterium]|jgi:hypothetical protein|nr:hypothetical protein [Acetobacteraceae bacterium]
MSKNDIGAVAEAKSVEPKATKDTGRVRIGGGTIHYDEVTQRRPETKDAGRTRIGGGTISF